MDAAPVYRIGGYPCGYMVIINYCMSRSKDADMLKEMGKALGFHVQKYDNLSAAATIALLYYICQVDHSRCYCLFVAILAEGDECKFKAADEKAITLNKVMAAFKSIKNKPKIFLFHISKPDHSVVRACSQESHALLGNYHNRYAVHDDEADDEDTFKIMFMHRPDQEPTYVEKFTREMAQNTEKSEFSEVLVRINYGYSGLGTTDKKCATRRLILPRAPAIDQAADR